MKPLFFRSAAELRRWFERHAGNAGELLVGFHRRETGEPSPTWSEAVDEALCFGWIDGVRRSFDATRYTVRFTPRKTTSTWSAVNVAKVAALEKAGKMTAAGRAAFAHRRENRSGIYSYEQRPEALPAPHRAVLDATPAAARDFDARPPSYRRAAIWWVVSAKQEATRERRLATLVDLHRRGEPIPQFTRRPPPGPAKAKVAKKAAKPRARKSRRAPERPAKGR